MLLDGTATAKPQDPASEGWTFGGWFTDDTFATAVDFDSLIAADTTYLAKWTSNGTPDTEPTVQPPLPVVSC